MMQNLLRKIRNHKDCEELQNDINKINEVYEWSKTWETFMSVTGRVSSKLAAPPHLPVHTILGIIATELAGV